MYLSSNDKREFFIDLLSKLNSLVEKGSITPDSAWPILIAVAKDHPDWPEEEAKPERAEAKVE